MSRVPKLGRSAFNWLEMLYTGCIIGPIIDVLIFHAPVVTMAFSSMLFTCGILVKLNYRRLQDQTTITSISMIFSGFMLGLLSFTFLLPSYRLNEPRAVFTFTISIIASLAFIGAVHFRLIPWGFRRYKHPLVLQAIDILSNGTAEERKLAVTELAEVDTPEITSALIPALHDSDPNVRVAVANTLTWWRMTEFEVIAKALTDTLRDPVPEVRVSAVNAIRDRGILLNDKPTVEILLSMLRDPDAQVREATVTAFRPLSFFVGDLLSQIMSDPKHEERYSAAWALGEADLSLSQMDLYAWLRRDPDYRTTSFDKEINSALIAALSVKDSTMRYEAARTLGKRKLNKAIPHLITLLGDKESTVRGAAAWALGELRANKALSALQQLLNDRELDSNGQPVREVAQAAIEQIRTKR